MALLLAELLSCGGITFSKEGHGMSAGEKLRVLREKLGFTLKDVEIASLQLVHKYNNPKYWLPQSRLCHIESKGILPNIYRLQAFALIYRQPLMELLALYGVDPQQSQALPSPPRTHLTGDAMRVIEPPSLVHCQPRTRS